MHFGLHFFGDEEEIKFYHGVKKKKKSKALWPQIAYDNKT